MIRPEFAEPGTEIDVQILGKTRRATVIPESPYDPDNHALRS
jgi:dimethylglycine dehydrogenase